MQGSYIPFPRNRAERERASDPRPSVEERYGSRAEYLGRVTEAALALIRAVDERGLREIHFGGDPRHG